MNRIALVRANAVLTRSALSSPRITGSRLRPRVVAFRSASSDPLLSVADDQDEVVSLDASPTVATTTVSKKALEIQRAKERKAKARVEARFAIDAAKKGADIPYESVRVLSSTKTNLGVMSVEEAMKDTFETDEFELVVLNPRAVPPVVVWTLTREANTARLEAEFRESDDTNADAPMSMSAMESFNAKTAEIVSKGSSTAKERRRQSPASSNSNSSRSKKKKNSSSSKGIMVGTNIGGQDLEHKIQKGRGFLLEKNTLRVEVVYKRSKALKFENRAAAAQVLMASIAERLSDIAKENAGGRRDLGNRMRSMFVPLGLGVNDRTKAEKTFERTSVTNTPLFDASTLASSSDDVASESNDGEASGRSDASSRRRRMGGGNVKSRSARGPQLGEERTPRRRTNNAGPRPNAPPLATKLKLRKLT